MKPCRYFNRRYLLPALGFLFLASRVAAASDHSDCLWLEFRAAAKGAGQPVNIFFGSFPAQKKDIAQIQDLRADVSFGEGDGLGREKTYPLRIETGEEGARVVIESGRAGWCMVTASGWRPVEGTRHEYRAKLAFFIAAGKAARLPEPAGSISGSGPYIELYRERIRESIDYVYSRRRLFPIRASVYFDGKRIPRQKVLVIDQEGRRMQFVTDRWGDIVYIPSRTENLEFQHDLILFALPRNGTIYHGTYSVLFERVPETPRVFDLGLGIGLTVFSAALTAFLIVVKRKKFKYEGL